MSIFTHAECGLTTIPPIFIKRYSSYSSLETNTHIYPKGGQSDDYAGLAVSSAGDFNGDGIKDLLIGATNPSDNGSGSNESHISSLGNQWEIPEQTAEIARASFRKGNIYMKMYDELGE